MDIQKQNKMCFDIDQNTQKINYLQKKSKQNEQNISTLNQNISSNQTSITNLNTIVSTQQSAISDFQTDIDNLQDDIEQLQEDVEQLQNSSGSGSSSGSVSSEEKIDLLSYDIIKVKDNTYRNNMWEPMPIFFRCQKGTKAKIHINFDINNTYVNKTLTSTTTITLDGITICTSTKSYATTGNEIIDFEHTFSSNTSGHKLVISVTSDISASTSSYYTKPDYFTVEIFGTEVQFVTRNNDFAVVPFDDTKVEMTSTCIDEKPRFSLQTANSSLDMSSTNFTARKFGGSREFNNAIPYPYYTITNGTPTFSTGCNAIYSNYASTSTNKRICYASNMTDDENTTISHDSIMLLGSFVARPTLLSGCQSTVKNQCKFVSIQTTNVVVFVSKGNNYYQQRNPAGELCADCCGVLRLNNYGDFAYPIIITRADGTSYIFNAKEVSDSTLQITELGFGTNVNAYLLADGKVHIYMRVGNNIKHLTLELNSQTDIYTITSTQLIQNCQEYWLAPNNCHFERFGDTISFYPQNATSPTSTHKVYY